ncbi:PREDICTED: eukaryotic translation initiation factor 5A-5-like [Tarenaya hassleriana]|uniref:eukaryotic translation initiation factor 5A-5-like n=1 Tax=Tarenaya hassleriana TaxID=28532 RepID=UPI00053C3030|nr:PREDICTED: eukaryotic translation initiation factor 5A-5-like [Tarenaya hassleriana]
MSGSGDSSGDFQSIRDVICNAGVGVGADDCARVPECYTISDLLSRAVGPENSNWSLIPQIRDIVPFSYNCDDPQVNHTDYPLIDISEDGFLLSLLTDNGNAKDDLRLPTDETLLRQIKSAFGDGKDLLVSVMSAMGEEHICGLKDIGPKS